MVVLTAVLAIGGLTFLLATLIILANRRLYVEEDLPIDVVEEMLPHANCGACGYPGCRPFAEALVSGAVAPGKCSVSDEQGRQAIADYLAAWNESPRPFVWTASVEDIIRKLDRARRKLEAIKPGSTKPRQQRTKG